MIQLYFCRVKKLQKWVVKFHPSYHRLPIYKANYRGTMSLHAYNERLETPTDRVFEVYLTMVILRGPVQWVEPVLGTWQSLTRN